MHEKLSRQTQTDTTHSTETNTPVIQHFINYCLILNKVFPDLWKGSWMMILQLNLVNVNAAQYLLIKCLKKNKKNVKGKGSVIGFTKQKELVAR